MGNSVELRSARIKSGSAGAAAVPEELLRLLLKTAVPAGTSTTSENAGCEEIVIDLNVDGFRYMLVRLPLVERSTHMALSPREQEIARMVAKGHQNKTIADVLSISSWTVCTHLRRIFAKLGVNSRAAMVARLHEIDLTRREGQGARAVR
jgi:DNA-binding CsgD family transcriptional regulator